MIRNVTCKIQNVFCLISEGIVNFTNSISVTINSCPYITKIDGITILVLKVIKVANQVVKWNTTT